jgi:hypothetical protein
MMHASLQANNAARIGRQRRHTRRLRFYARVAFVQRQRDHHTRFKPELFDQLHDLADVEGGDAAPAAHEVDFLLPGSVPGA